MVVRDQNRDGKGSEDVENQDTDVDSLDRPRDVTTRVLGLASSDCDNLKMERDMHVSFLQRVATVSLRVPSVASHLGTNERERGLDEDSPEAQEAAEGAWDVFVLDKGTRVFPVAETKPVVVRTTSEVEDEGQDDQTDDRDDFDGCEPEFGLAVRSGTED